MKNVGKKFVFVVFVVIFFVVGLFFVQGVEKLSLVIYVVIFDWVSGVLDVDIQKVFDGVEMMVKNYDGIICVWLCSIKLQIKQVVFVMEFESEQVFKDYVGSDVQKVWYEVYMLVCGCSVMSDIMN